MFNDDYEPYMIIKTIIYLVAGFLALFIATCSGGCALEAVATGEHKDLGYIIWTIAFGIVAIVCLSGFSRSKNVIEKFMKDEKEEEDATKTKS